MKWQRLIFWWMAGVLVLLLPWGCGSGGHAQKRGSSIIFLKGNVKSYDNIARSDAIEVDFPKEITVRERNEPISGEVPPGLEGKKKIEWDKLTVFLNGVKVGGRLFISGNRRKVYFVSKGFLEGNKDYKVVLSSSIKYTDGSLLGQEVVFTVHVKKSGDLFKLSIKDPVSKEYQFDVSFESAFDPWKIVVDRDTARSQDDLIVTHDTQVTLQYEKPGPHRLQAKAYDAYGRYVSREAIVNILPNLIDLYEGKYDSVKEVESADIEQVPQGDLRDIFKENPQDISDLASIQTDTNGSSFWAAVLKSSEIANAYVQKLIDNGRFLGVALFGSYPAVLSSEKEEGKTYLRITVLKSPLDLNISRRSSGGSFSIRREGSGPWDLLYTVRAETETQGIEDLKAHLENASTKNLPLLYWKEGNLHLRTVGSGSSTRRRGYLSSRAQTRGVGDWIVGIKDTAKKYLQGLWDFITEDTLKIVGSFKNIIQKIVDIDLAKQIPKYTQLRDTLKGRYEGIKQRYESIEGLIGSKTDADALIKKSREFISGGSNNLEEFFKSVLREMERQSEYLGKGFSVLQSAGGSFGDIVNSLLEDPSQDAMVQLAEKEGTLYLKLQKGSDVYSFGIDAVAGWLEFSEQFLGEIPGFPLSSLKSLMDKMQNYYPSIEALLAYKGGEKEIDLIVKNATDAVKCENDNNATFCFDTVMSESDQYADFRINATRYASLLLHFAPVEPLIPPIDGSDAIAAIFDVLSKGTSFPEASVDLRLGGSEHELKIHASTHPDITVGAGVELALEGNYHLLVGGKGKVGLTLGVGIDPVALTHSSMEFLHQLILNEYNATVSNLNLVSRSVEENGVTYGVLNLFDDQTFIQFLESYAGGLYRGLQDANMTELGEAITFSVGFSPEVGLGVGAGGTGTGGANANLKVGAEVGLSFDLDTFVQSFITMMDVYDIDEFLIGPVKKMGALFARAAQDAQAGGTPGGPVAAVMKNGLLGQSVQLLKGTFVKLIEATQESQETVALFDKMARKMSLSFGLEIGEEAEAEEAGSVEQDVKLQPSLSVNGETIFNVLQGVVGNEETVKFFDHAGVYPEITLGFPVNAYAKEGFDEGIKISYTVSMQGDFFHGTFSIKSDPFLGSSSVGEENATLTLPLRVVLQSDSSEVDLNDSATLSCQAIPSQSTIIHWYLGDVEIEGDGSINGNDGKVLAEVSVQNQGEGNSTLTLSPKAPGELVVSCIAENAEGKTAFDTRRIERINHAPVLEGVELPEDGVIYTGQTIEINATDSDGDALHYIVEFSDNPDFSGWVGHYEMDSGVFRIPDSWEPGTYYLRVKVSDGWAESAWSSVRKIAIEKMVSNTGFTIWYTRTDGTSVSIEDNASVAFDEIDPQEGVTVTPESEEDAMEHNAQLQIAVDPEFHQIKYKQTYDEQNGFGNWMPHECRSYYVRLAFYPETHSGTVLYSSVQRFAVIPSSPELLSPEEDQDYLHRSILRLSAESPAGGCSCIQPAYRFEFSSDQNFSEDRVDSGWVESKDWNMTLPTLDHEPYRRSYFVRAQKRCADVESRWSSPIKIWVNNYPPVPRRKRLEILSGAAPGSSSEDPKICIDGRISVHYDYIDQDPIASSHIDFFRDTEKVLSVSGENEENVTLPDYGTYRTEAYATDIYGASTSREYYDTYPRQRFTVHVLNCPPRPVGRERLSGPDSRSLVIPGQTLYFTVDQLNRSEYDPDGDPIVRCRLRIKKGENVVAQLDSNVSEDANGMCTWEYTPDEIGTYSWSVMLVSRDQDNEEEQKGEWSEPITFSVVPPPKAKNLTPENGSFYFEDEVRGLKLSAKVENVNLSNIRAMQFAWSQESNFSQETKSPWIAAEEADENGIFSYDAPTEAGVWYWHARASYEVAGGPWSDPFCYTVEENEEFASYRPSLETKDSVEMDADGAISLPLKIVDRKKSCRNGEVFDSFEYQICSSADCNGTVVSHGRIEDLQENVNANVESAGNYYVRVNQIIRKHTSAWSVPKAVKVLPHPQIYFDFNGYSKGDTQVEGREGFVAGVEGTPGVVEQGGPDGKAIALSGEEDLVVAHDQAMDLRNFTLSMWINPKNVDAESVLMLHKDRGGVGYGLFVKGGRILFRLYYHDGTVSKTAILQSVSVPEGFWSHIAATFDGEKAKLYLNGLLAEEKSIDGRMIYDVQGAPLYLGADKGGETPYVGMMDEVRLYDQAWSAEIVGWIMRDIRPAWEEPEAFPAIGRVRTEQDGTTVMFEVDPCIEGMDYLWDFDNDGNFDTKSKCRIRHDYGEYGTYEAIVYPAGNGAGWKSVPVETGDGQPR